VYNRDEDCEEANDVKDQDKAFESRKKPDQDCVDENREQQYRVHDEGSMPSWCLVTGDVESQKRLDSRASEVRSGRSGGLPA